MPTTQFDFSNDDWEHIADTPILVGFAVARAEDSGFVGTIRETRALIAAIAEGAEGNPARSLIDGAAANEVKDKLKGLGATAPDFLADAAVEACARLVTVLAAAEADESAGYRRWVLAIATSVAEAAKERRVRVSLAEAELIGRLTVALDLA